MKTISKLLLVIITLSLVFSVCGCTRVTSIARDIPRAVELASNLASLAKIGNTDEALKQGEQYLHTKSNLTAEKIRKLIEEDEDIKALNLEGSARQISVGNIGTPSYKEYNEALGGNIYEMSAVVTIDGHPLNVSIFILSDDGMMGLYSFDISASN